MFVTALLFTPVIVQVVVVDEKLKFDISLRNSYLAANCKSFAGILNVYVNSVESNVSPSYQPIHS